MDAVVGELIERHFPWGMDGHPAKPPDAGDRERYVLRWLGDELIRYRIAAIELIRCVRLILEELEAGLPNAEQPRLLARFDVSWLTKSPASILEKMCRNWVDRTRAPKLGFANLWHEATDLARPRIVANFLSDVREIAEALEHGYCHPGAGLTPGQQFLRREFHLRENRFEDNVMLRLDERRSGSRNHKGVFYSKHPTYLGCQVEVQVMTILQEAWDKKDHFLIYETKRKGNPVALEDEVQMAAQSESLYLADEVFDTLKERIVHRRAGHGK